MQPPPDAATVWRPRWPVDLAATLGPLAHGRGDPAQRWYDGALWRTVRSPEGPATLRLVSSRAGVHAQAWGAGAHWCIAGLPDLLGARDSPDGFEPCHPMLRAAALRHPGLRIGRLGLVLEVLVPIVLEQKVTGAEARRSWRELVRRFGAPAPGPAPVGMRVVPDAATWRRVPSWEWHRAGVDAKRARTVLTAASAATALERTVGLPADEVRTRLLAVPGVGVWTAAEVAQRAHGDADAVSVGDYHLPSFVGWALTGRPLDDDGMLAVLAPYRPHRHRVVRLLELSGFRAPRFGPRLPVRDFRRL